jgi:hypothetical protein
MTMTEWTAIAKARGLDLSPAELDRASSVLGQMEQVYRPLVQELTPQVEPSTEFHIPEDGE